MQRWGSAKCTRKLPRIFVKEIWRHALPRNPTELHFTQVQRGAIADVEAEWPTVAGEPLVRTLAFIAFCFAEKVRGHLELSQLQACLTGQVPWILDRWSNVNYWRRPNGERRYEQLLSVWPWTHCICSFDMALSSKLWSFQPFLARIFRFPAKVCVRWRSSQWLCTPKSLEILWLYR